LTSSTQGRRANVVGPSGRIAWRDCASRVPRSRSLTKSSIASSFRPAARDVGGAARHQPGGDEEADDRQDSQHFEHRFAKVDKAPEPLATAVAKLLPRLYLMAEKDYSETPLTRKLGAKPGADVVVYFTTSSAELRRRFAKLKRTLASADGLWIAYPKKSSKLETDLTFETVQRIGLDSGLVDNKIVAVDDDWSAIRFVYRVQDRR
jgi:hypothetical protein